MSSNVSFRRINGRIIPILQGANVARRVATTGMADSRRTKLKGLSSGPVAPHMGLKALALGSAVASGVISGATFFGGGIKTALYGTGASIGLDAVSSGANAAAHLRGPGTKKQKAIAFGKNEALNTVIGNAAFVGTLLAIPSSRARVLEYGAKALNWIRRIK